MNSYELVDGIVQINTNNGENAHIRRTIQKWLILCSQDFPNLSRDLNSTSPNFRRTLLRWMLEHIGAKSMDDNVVKLENEIRTSLGNFWRIPSLNQR